MHCSLIFCSNRASTGEIQLASLILFNLLHFNSRPPVAFRYCDLKSMVSSPSAAKRGSRSFKKARAPPLKKSSAQLRFPHPTQSVQPIEIGSGTFDDPFRRPLSDVPNTSGCFHCPTVSCECDAIGEAMSQAYEEVDRKRITEVCGARHLCAKSLLPQFVSRFVRLMNITEKDTFVDLGCGNGSILFQVAYATGARCVGVELSPQNAEVAREAWKGLKPVLEKKSGRSMPEVEIITGDLCGLISMPWFITTPNIAILTSNLLFPKHITHYMSERFRLLPSGARILCFDDLYPHSRSVARIRDPEAFELFHMVDYVWQRNSVEWTFHEGNFYIHTRH